MGLRYYFRFYVFKVDDIKCEDGIDGSGKDRYFT